MQGFADLGVILPELWLAVAGMGLLMLGVFVRCDAARVVFWLAVLVLIVTGVLVQRQVGPEEAFGSLVVVDAFGVFMKTLVVAGTVLVLVMSWEAIRREGMDRFEYPVLVVFAVLGMFVMISANDLLSLYVGLEMQSLALYICAAFQRDDLRSSEAGLKYFVLGAVASGMLLYGCSMVYGFAGTTSFTALASLLAGSDVSPGIVTGLVFVVAGLAFKISAVPFHMWTPDVYEGAPTPVTAFFSVAPKIAAMALLLRTMTGPFAGLFEQWQQRAASQTSRHSDGPPRLCRSPMRCGGSSGWQTRLTPMPTTTASSLPERLEVSTRMPQTLRPATRMSLGHLHRARDSCGASSSMVSATARPVARAIWGTCSIAPRGLSTKEV